MGTLYPIVLSKMSKMKILIVSPTLNHGGAERVASLWAKGFAERGHRVFFVANIEEEEAYSLGYSIHLLPLTNPNGNRIMRYLGAVKRLRRYYKEYRPDVIIGVMYACSLLAKMAELGLGIPVINTEHSAFERPKDYPMTHTDHFAKFWLNYLYDGTTILTKTDINIIKKRFKKLFLLPNPTFLTPLDVVPCKQNVLLAAGRIGAWHVKGFDVLLKAWVSVFTNVGVVDKWKLEIAGDGSPESFKFLMDILPDGMWKQEGSRRFSEKYNIEFLGFRKDIEELYRRSSIFVLSSRFEGFGMVLVEAMSQGCAPIACDYKGRQSEIIHNEQEGICCEIDNVDALASSLEKMIKDSGYRQNVQKNAIKRSLDYTSEIIMDRWDLILKDYV